MTECGQNVSAVFGVRPALYLNRKSILFVSAAQKGKSAATAGGTAVDSLISDRNEWKLTVKDEIHEDFRVESCEEVVGGKIEITYSGAVTGDHEYLSYYILNPSGEVVSYAKICACETESGTVTFDDPAREEDDKLYVINEQANGDFITDYASEPQILFCKHEFSVCLECDREAEDLEMPSMVEADGSTISEGSVAILVGIAGLVIGAIGTFLIMRKKNTALSDGAEDGEADE